MVSFKDVAGDENGELLNYYALYIALFLLFSIIYYVGIFRILYKLVQQALIILLMLGMGSLWLTLVSKHFEYMLEAASGNSAAAKVFDSLLSKEALQDSDIIRNGLETQELVGPISEMILITGTTMCLLAWLYRQLPIDLIPDCIPCIGKYDNMLASVFIFFGLVVTACGAYLQWYHVTGPSSTRMAFAYFEDVNESVRKFMSLDTEQQANKLADLAREIMLSAVKFATLLKQGLVFVAGKIQNVIGTKQEL